MAPELFMQKSYSEKVDIFAFGTLLWELLSNEVPYEGIDPIDIKRQVVAGTSQLSLHYNLSRYQSLVDNCRASDPSVRPSFREIHSQLNS
jgi:serine/threonine protein kinase